MRGIQLWSVKLHSLGVFVSCCLGCRLVAVVVFHHQLKLGVGQSLNHLVKVIVVVEVLNSVRYFGTERVVVVVCLFFVLSGYHPRHLFYVDLGELYYWGLGMILFV